MSVPRDGFHLTPGPVLDDVSAIVSGVTAVSQRSPVERFLPHAKCLLARSSETAVTAREEDLERLALLNAVRGIVLPETPNFGPTRGEGETAPASTARGVACLLPVSGGVHMQS